MAEDGDPPIFAVRFAEPVDFSQVSGCCTVYCRSHNGSSASPYSGHKILVSRSKSVDRIGEVNDKITKYTLVLFNKRTKSLEMRKLHLVEMHAVIKAPASTTTVDKVNAQDLNQKFGSERHLKRMVNRARGTIQKESIIGANVLKESISEKLPKESEISQHHLSPRVTPPYNPDATLPSEVYDLESIAPQKILDRIEICHLLDMDKSQLSQSLPYISKCTPWIFGQIVHSVGSNPKVIRQLIFLAYMVNLYNVRSGKINGDLLSNLIGHPPKPVFKFLTSSFTEEGRDNMFNLPRNSKDKLLSYALCLLLSIGEYRFDPEHIAQDLKESKKKVVKFSRCLGCRHTSFQIQGSNKKVKLLSLTLPLEFPKARLR